MIRAMSDDNTLFFRPIMEKMRCKFYVLNISSITEGKKIYKGKVLHIHIGVPRQRQTKIQTTNNHKSSSTSRNIFNLHK